MKKTKINKSMNILMKVSEWKDAIKQLPKKDDFYNVFVETDERYLVHSLWFENGNWKYDNYMIAGEPIYATAWYATVLFWQELPEQPIYDKATKY
jgi:hypothetical protein